MACRLKRRWRRIVFSELSAQEPANHAYFIALSSQLADNFELPFLLGMRNNGINADLHGNSFSSGCPRPVGDTEQGGHLTIHANINRSLALFGQG